jgi:hypothetical protein
VAAAGAWRLEPHRQLLLVAGAAAGVAAGSKYTIGFLALVAAGALVVRRSPRAIVPIAAAAAGVFLLAMLPVLLTGGGPRFLEYGFTAKGNYVEAGNRGYLPTAEIGLRRLWDALTSPSRGTLQTAATGLMVLSPLVAALVAFPAWRRGAPAAVLLFAALAIAGAFPRYEERHMMNAFAGPLLLIGVAAHLWLPRGSLWRRAALLGGIGWVAANAAGGLLPVGGARPTDVAHMRGVFIPPDTAADLRAHGRQLRRVAEAGPLLIVSGSAGLGYLISGVRNATAYDYPVLSAMGKTGEAETAAQVRAGRFAAVCLAESIDEETLRPRTLERAIRESMDRAEPAPLCRIYRRR